MGLFATIFLIFFAGRWIRLKTTSISSLKSSAGQKKNGPVARFYAGYSVLSRRHFCGSLRRSMTGLTFTAKRLKKNRRAFFPADRWGQVPVRRTGVKVMNPKPL